MDISIIISIAALVISGLSLWFSWRAQRHTQIVSFEQRRQEVRQTFLEGQLLTGQGSEELNRALLMCENQLIVGKMSEGLKRRFLEGTKSVQAGIANNATVRHEFEKVLKELDQIPSSPSTQDRLELERLGGKAVEMKNKQRKYFEQLHNVIQGLDDTLKTTQSNKQSP